MTITSTSSEDQPTEIRVYQVADLAIIPLSLLGGGGGGGIGGGGERLAAEASEVAAAGSEVAGLEVAEEELGGFGGGGWYRRFSMRGPLGVSIYRMNSSRREIPTVSELAKIVLTAGFVLGLVPTHPASAATPRVGRSRPDFSLQTPAGESVRLATLNEKGPVVLVVLRGWPGYQCPICTKQVGELIARSKELNAARAQVVLVYPGPSAGLKEHAEDFARGKSIPNNFHLVLDPDYAFTRSYDLRWEAPGETAYPSTFVIDSRGMITFAATSRTHGGRPPTEDVVGALRPH